MRLAALAILSGSGLFLEIALTRVLSTVYYPPFVFAVISLAILGIGLGAALASYRRTLRDEAYLPIYSLLAGVSTLILLAGIVWIVSYTLRPVLFVLVGLPYLFIGLSLAGIFSAAPERSTVYYMADLGGAGIGAIVVLLVLDMIGPLNAVPLAAAGFGLSSLALQPSANGKSVVFVLVALALSVSSIFGGWLSVDISRISTEKPIVMALADGRLIETRWDSFARTDLVAPDDGGPYQLFVDGAAGSIMPPGQDNQFLMRDIGFFPFATGQPDNVLIIGPGGGLDVWFGLAVNAEHITAVEVNPASVDMVHDFADYNGDLYGQPTVEIITDEGRSVLQRENTRYDLIFLSQVITETAERSGYALTENTIYTVEAFQEYLAHLTPDGQIALKLYDEPTLTRALSVALAAFAREGISNVEALRRIGVLLDTQVDPPVPLLLIRRSPFTSSDALAHGAVAREVGFTPLFLPGVLAQPPLDQVEAGSMLFQQVIDESNRDISATTDNRPFFFQFERGIPTAVQSLLWVCAAIIVVGSTLITFAQRRVTSLAGRWSPLYFAGLGIGFICIEIAIIQQTRVYLGHPTLAITTVISTFLIVGGIGSLLAGNWIGHRPDIIPASPPALVMLATLAWMFVWGRVDSAIPPASVIIRILIVITTLTPLTLLLGMPFALGLRAFSQNADQGRLVAMGWAVNGVATVLGTVGAVALSLLWGYNSVLYAGILAYAVALSVAYLSQSSKAFKSA